MGCEWFSVRYLRTSGGFNDCLKLEVVMYLISVDWSKQFLKSLCNHDLHSLFAQFTAYYDQKNLTKESKTSPHLYNFE